ncbi:SchA/CurD-like domain-containing protein [Streptacidiphilus anmyonensis]|uniref:SchA/CurD-like domain-containing protein n=1 Tax=Streptacidiphilus anmyonensis TaxID=405782 RepID=UPI0007C69F24
MTTDDTKNPMPTSADGHLRVVLLLDVHEGQEQRFLAAYDQIRHQVASVPGHISDQLCQSLGNSSQWLITSEWESAEPFLSWVDSDAHRALVEPLHNCVTDTRSLRFVIARQTPETGFGHGRGPSERAARAARAAAGVTPGRPVTGRPARSTDPLPAPPLASGGLVRHAIAFTVKPGSEERVAEILSGYESPRAQVDETTRLCRTSLFMRGNQVVRAVEVKGDLGNALRHVAMQPEVRRVEEAINPYLEEARDLADPTSARAFFAHAALPAVRHAADGRPADGGEVTRHAFLYPVRRGHAVDAARLLGEHDVKAAAAAGSPLAQSTMFARDDLLMRMVDLRRPYQEVPGHAAGLDSGTVEQLRLHLDFGDPTFAADEPALARFLAGCAMRPITDRVSASS